VEDEPGHDPKKLKGITNRIASICKPDWFSTEIALADDSIFIVMDYVNNQINTRIKSQAMGGVPDEVMNNTARQLVKIAKENTL